MHILPLNLFIYESSYIIVVTEPDLRFLRDVINMVFRFGTVETIRIARQQLCEHVPAHNNRGTSRARAAKEPMS
jgi:hypothetical protein